MQHSIIKTSGSTVRLGVGRTGTNIGASISSPQHTYKWAANQTGPASAFPQSKVLGVSADH